MTKSGCRACEFRDLVPDLSTAVDIGGSEEHGLTVQYRPSGIWLCRFDACGETARHWASFWPDVHRGGH